MSPIEEELRRLTTVKALVRREIDITRDMRKKEILRKKYEKIDYELDLLLSQMKLNF